MNGALNNFLTNRGQNISAIPLLVANYHPLIFAGFMALPYELLIGLRYTRAKRRNHFISFISMISMLGIGLGVAALIVVLSVMNGFQKDLRSRILGVASHIQITGVNGELENWPALAAQAMQHPEVRDTAPFVQSQA